jgi:hypothetical protein
MEACANLAMSMNVIYNDIYPADSPLKLNNIIENGEFGSCAITGKWNRKHYYSCLNGIPFHGAFS